MFLVINDELRNINNIIQIKQFSLILSEIKILHTLRYEIDETCIKYILMK